MFFCAKDAFGIGNVQLAFLLDVAAVRPVGIGVAV